MALLLNPFRFAAPATNHLMATRTTNLIMPSQTWVDLPFPTVSTDTNNIYNTTTGEITIKTAGVYLICIAASRLPHFQTDPRMRLLKNGAELLGTEVRTGGGAEMDTSSAHILNLAVNDVIKVQVYQDNASQQTYVHHANRSSLNVHYLGAASHYVRARHTSTQSLPNANTVTLIYDVEDEDAGSNYDPTTGLYVAPATGYYLVKAGIAFGGSLARVRAGIAIATNGVVDGNTYVYDHMPNSNLPRTWQTFSIRYVSAGQTISAVGWHKRGSSHPTSAVDTSSLEIQFLGATLSNFVEVQDTTPESWAQNVTATRVYETEVADALGQYDPATGVFTANSAGYYVILMMGQGLNAPASTGTYWNIEVQDSANVNLGYAPVASFIHSSNEGRLDAYCHPILKLEAGGTFKPVFRNGNATTHASIANTIMQVWRLG